MEGDKIKTKARLVVPSNMGTGLIAGQIQSPTCGKEAIRILLVIKAKEGFEVKMIDLTNAYFQAELSERKQVISCSTDRC